MTQLFRILPLFAAMMIAGSLATIAQWPLAAQTMRPTLSRTPLSERLVDYQIDAHYDGRQKSLDAIETLTYHNLTGQPLDTFPFHLYLNAFQPTSTFMREVRLDKPSFEWQ